MVPCYLDCVKYSQKYFQSQLFPQFFYGGRVNGAGDIFYVHGIFLNSIVTVVYGDFPGKLSARMVKLADTPASGAGAREGMQVQVLFRAPNRRFSRERYYGLAGASFH